MKRRGLLIILSSPSGAGKSTLAGRLRAWDSSLSFSVSATTREPRTGEVDGKDYFFVTTEEFQSQVSNGEMLEHARVFGNYYGSPKGPVQEAIDASTLIGRVHSR
jgi:guanylate kinase